MVTATDTQKALEEIRDNYNIDVRDSITTLEDGSDGCLLHVEINYEKPNELGGVSYVWSTPTQEDLPALWAEMIAACEDRYGFKASVCVMEAAQSAGGIVLYVDTIDVGDSGGGRHA